MYNFKNLPNIHKCFMIKCRNCIHWQFFFVNSHSQTHFSGFRDSRPPCFLQFLLSKKLLELPSDGWDRQSLLNQGRSTSVVHLLCAKASRGWIFGVPKLILSYIDSVSVRSSLRTISSLRSDSPTRKFNFANFL